MASERQYFVTEEGLAALEKELEELKTVGRREVAEKIKVALSFGDLSENSEYDEAKNDQAMMEARIADLEVMLQGAVVIDESELTNEKVHIGSRIEVDITSSTGAQSRRDFKIVGSNEADPRNGKISDESAVGKASSAPRWGTLSRWRPPLASPSTTLSPFPGKQGGSKLDGERNG